MEQSARMILRIATHFSDHPVIVVADSWFGNNGLYKLLKGQTGEPICLLSRLRANNILFDLPHNLINPLLEIYNIKGQIIESIGILTNQNSIIWDASKHSTGIYLYKINADNFISGVKKMTLLK